MKTKTKKILPVLFALSAFVCAAHFQAVGQEDGPYAVVIYKAVNGQVDNDSKQSYRIGGSQEVKFDRHLPANAAYWINVSRGFTVNMSKENADTSVSAGGFKEGKYRLSTNGVLAAVITVKKIYPDDKVTLFSERDYTGMAFDYGVGFYPANKGALFAVGGENAVSSVHVPEGFWVRLCGYIPKGSSAYKCEMFNGRSGNLENDNTTTTVKVGKGIPPKFNEPQTLPKPQTKPLPTRLPKWLQTQKPIS